MAYLEELIPHRKYDRWDFVRALRTLLPRGRLWIIPLPDESDIQPNSILSSEAFGRVTISSGIVYITPNGIVSGEGFGLAIVAPTAILVMSGIASAEAWGSPTVGNAWTQFCDFESNLCSGWDSAFTTNWSQTTESGEGIAQRASDGWDRLYPVSGTKLTGDFSIEFGIWRSATETGNISIHFRLNDTGVIADIAYNGTLYGLNGGSNAMAAGPSEQRMKIERVSGTIWAYRWTGSAWEREDSWSTPGSSVSNSNDVYVDVNGADGVNGFTYIGINGALI